MALSKDGLYWKASDITVNRQSKTANIVLKGYFSKASCDNHDLQKENKFVTLSGNYYPFVNGLTIDQIGNVYTMIKASDSYFKDALDV